MTKTNNKLPLGVDPKDIITKLVPGNFVGGSVDTGAWVFYQSGVYYERILSEEGVGELVWHWTDGDYDTDNDCDEVYEENAEHGCLAWFPTTEAAIEYAKTIKMTAPIHKVHPGEISNVYVEDRTGIVHEIIYAKGPNGDWYLMTLG